MEQSSKKRKISENGKDCGKDEAYFQSYSLIQCHQTMVSDKIRTQAFKLSILRSYQHLFKKTVLEIGCGTGILSVFACQAGASRVYAVEASNAIEFAQRVVEKNGYLDTISLVNSRVEDFVPPQENEEKEEKVDAIISEWMGYALFCEWMLPSVISTRDRLLKEGGLLFPNKVSVFMALATETDFVRSRAAYWLQDPASDYKVDMSVLAEEEYKALIGKIVVQDVEPPAIVSAPNEILCIDLNTIKYSDCDYFTSNFRITAFGSCHVYGFCVWFKVFFPAEVDFDTSPFSESTHWHQTMLYVPPFPVRQDTVVHGSITFRRHPTYLRCAAVDIDFAVEGDEKKASTKMQFLDMLEA